MDKDGFLEVGSEASSSDTPGAVRARLFAGKHKSSFSKAVIKRLQQELRGLWSSDVRKPAGFPLQPHGESSFRFLLLNEMKRSERSGHSFHVLLTYFEEADHGPTKIDDQVRDTLVPILANMLRETDYLGWYEEDQILGGVLTALRERTADEVASRIEQRFWWRMGKEFQIKDFARLRVRLFPAQEFMRLQSANSLFTPS